MTPSNTLRFGVALRTKPPCMISLAHRRVNFQGVGSYRAGRGVVARAGAPSDVFVLDFEGVLVDSQTQGFAGVKEVLASCEYPFYVASAGAADTVSSAASEQLGLLLGADSPRLFAGLQPAADKKAGCLREIGERPICKETKAKLHFIDDEPDVLRAVAEDADLKGRWQLYLAAWGDGSEGRAKAAQALPGVSVLSLKDFQELLKWGVLMGVDDGCEPTPEEVMEGVTGDLPSRS